MTDLLTVNDLHVRFATPGGHIDAVRGVSFRMRPASTLAIVGESGSGKSVLSQSIMRILPRNGAISHGAPDLFSDPRCPGEAVDLARLPADGSQMRAIRGGQISIIFQEPMSSLSPLHTIGDQVGEALRLHRDVTPAEARGLTIDMLRLVGFPDGERAWRSYAFELSGGLRQRAMIAMALVCRPALLIADEPTTALDVTIQAQILKLVVELQHELGMGVLLITHDLGVVANVAEEIVVMYRGEIMESGSLEDIFRRAQPLPEGAATCRAPHFDMQPGGDCGQSAEIPPGDAPHLIKPGVPEWPAEANGPLLECVDLRKSFGQRHGRLFRAGAGVRVVVVDGVSLTIERGECLGLVGNGCGEIAQQDAIARHRAEFNEVVFNDRGTLMDVLLALDQASLEKVPPAASIRFRIVLGSLNPRMCVEDIIAEPLVIHGVGDALAARDRQRTGLSGRSERTRSAELSAQLFRRPAATIEDTRALALRPELVICDEPVSALDVSIQAQILNLLIDLQKKLRLTYLFISHNLAVVDYMADRIAVMCAGRIVEMAPRGALFREPVHPYTQALLAAIPTADLEHHLDFEQLMQGRASDPLAWPEPFRRDPGRTPRQFEVGPSHWVDANAMPQLANIGELSLAGA